MSEARDGGEICFRVQRHCDVKSLRPGGFDPTWKTQLIQQRTQVQRCAAQHIQLMLVSRIARWIETSIPVLLEDKLEAELKLAAVLRC